MIIIIRCLIIAAFLSFFINCTVKAQGDIYGKTFHLDIVGGISFNQIDDDGAVGFNHYGFRSGLIIRTLRPNKLDFSLGFVFDQRGSTQDIGNIRMNYISLPASLIFKSWYVDELQRHKLEWLISLRFSRRLSLHSTHPLFQSTNGNYREFDLSYSAGLNYNFSKNISTQIRLQRSLSKLFMGIDESKSLRHYNAIIQFGYLIF